MVIRFIIVFGISLLMIGFVQGQKSISLCPRKSGINLCIALDQLLEACESHYSYLRKKDDMELNRFEVDRRLKEILPRSIRDIRLLKSKIENIQDNDHEPIIKLCNKILEENYIANNGTISNKKLKSIIPEIKRLVKLQEVNNIYNHDNTKADEEKSQDTQEYEEHREVLFSLCPDKQNINHCNQVDKLIRAGNDHYKYLDQLSLDRFSKLPQIEQSIYSQIPLYNKKLNILKDRIASINKAGKEDVLKSCNEIFKEYYIAKNWDKKKKYGVSLKTIIPQIVDKVQSISFEVKSKRFSNSRPKFSGKASRGNIVRDGLIGLSLCMNVLLLILYFKLKK